MIEHKDVCKRHAMHAYQLRYAEAMRKAARVSLRPRLLYVRSKDKTTEVSLQYMVKIMKTMAYWRFAAAQVSGLPYSYATLPPGRP